MCFLGAVMVSVMRSDRPQSTAIWCQKKRGGKRGHRNWKFGQHSASCNASCGVLGCEQMLPKTNGRYQARDGAIHISSSVKDDPGRWTVSTMMIDSTRDENVRVPHSINDKLGGREPEADMMRQLMQPSVFTNCSIYVYMYSLQEQ